MIIGSLLFSEQFLTIADIYLIRTLQATSSSAHKQTTVVLLYKLIIPVRYRVPPVAPVTVMVAKLLVLFATQPN
jgi:hypothetical protein